MGRTVASLIVLLAAAPARAQSVESAPGGADVPTLHQDEGGGDGSDDVQVPMSTQPPMSSQPPASSSSSGAGGGRGTGTLLAGRTLMHGDAVVAEFGWPGISFEYLHAQTRTTDLGAEFTFNYGREGLVDVDPGIKLQGVVRLMLFDDGKLNFGLRLDPGFALYFNDPFSFSVGGGGNTAFGISLPAALALGVSAGDAISLHFGFDFPLFFRITPTDNFEVELPFLFGAGLEYRIDSHLSMLFDCRFGPDVVAQTAPSTAIAEFAFRALLGIGYRI